MPWIAGCSLMMAAGGTFAWAIPIDDPDIGGIGFSGPTTGDPAAVYWNPAALGLTHGLRLAFSGTARLTTTTVSRASIDASGRPGPGTGFGDVRTNDHSQPAAWPPGPGAFAGVSYDVGGDRFTLAFATYMPFLERSRYEGAPGQPLATRYHRISADLRNLALVPALSVRLAGDFRIGFAPGGLLSTGRLAFAESTCAPGGTCAFAEDPSADALVDVGSGLGILSSKFAFTLAGGIYYRRRAWEVGISVSLPPLGDVGGSAVIVGDQSRVIGPGGQTVTCTNGRADGAGCVYADIVYKLPYTWIGAVAYHPRPGWEVTAIARMLVFPSNDAIDIRLTGAGLSAAGLPEHIVLYRGYGTAIDTRLRVATWINERLRLGGGIRVESNGLPARTVSPGAVDGWKVEPTAMALVRVVRHFWLAAGYGFTHMFAATATDFFDPTAAASCAAAQGDLRNSACLARLGGTARPTAAGTYHRSEHAFSLSATAEF